MRSTADHGAINAQLFFANASITLQIGHITNYALVQYALDLTASPSFGGLVYFCTFGGAALLTLYAGTLLDRVNRLRLVATCQPVYIFTLLALALLEASASRALIAWLLPFFALLNGASLAFLYPGRFALLSSFNSEPRLGRSIITLNIIIAMTAGLAPFAYGLLRSHLDWPGLFAALAILYAIGGMMLGGLRLSDAPAADFAAPRSTGLAAVRDIFRVPAQIRMLLFLTACAQIARGVIVVLLPQLAMGSIGSSEIARGAVVASIGVGLLIGGLVARQVVGSMHGQRPLALAVAATGLPLIGMPLVADVPALVAAFLVFGVLSGLVIPLLNSHVQILAPPTMLGRILSVFSFISFLAPAASGLVCGAIADIAGLATAIMLCGVVVVLLPIPVARRAANTP